MSQTGKYGLLSSSVHFGTFFELALSFEPWITLFAKYTAIP